MENQLETYIKAEVLFCLVIKSNKPSILVWKYNGNNISSEGLAKVPIIFSLGASPLRKKYYDSPSSDK